MRSYEMVAILSPIKQSNKCVEALDNLFKRHGVMVKKEEKWGEKKIFHPRDRNIRKALFLYRNCRIKPELLKDLSKDLQIDSHIYHFSFKRTT